MRLPVLLFAIVLSIALSACGSDSESDRASMTASPAAATATPKEATMTFLLTSDAFTDGESIPAHFTCDGDDVSPSLKWQAWPDGTESFALIMDDPDAPSGTFTHWLIHNINAQARALTEGVEKTERPASGEGGMQGKNDFGDIGYGGPCPPGGDAHHYNFRLYALDSRLDLDPGGSKDDLLKAMRGRIVGETTLTGTYKRR
jgi:Raf kinase inhibitor-like YbhB/YbcL family protein